MSDFDPRILGACIAVVVFVLVLGGAAVVRRARAAARRRRRDRFPGLQFVSRQHMSPETAALLERSARAAVPPGARAVPMPPAVRRGLSLVPTTPAPASAETLRDEGNPIEELIEMVQAVRADNGAAHYLADGGGGEFGGAGATGGYDPAPADPAPACEPAAAPEAPACYDGGTGGGES